MSFLLSPARAAPRSLMQASSALPRTFSTTRASSLARMTVIGRVGTDPEEVSNRNSGTEMLRYSVATSYGPKDNRQTSWFKVVSFPSKSNPLTREKIMSLTKG